MSHLRPFIKTGLATLTTALLLACIVSIPAALHAQQDADLDEFLSDGSPALLFALETLALEGYGGGVGLMISSSETLHWRLLLALEFHDIENSPTGDWLRRSRFGSLGFGASPSWILMRDGDFCITGGLLVAYSIQMWHFENELDGEVIPDSETTRHLVSAGLHAGAGYAISPSLLLQLEYRLTGGGRWEFRSGGDAKWMRADYRSTGLLVLGVRL